MAYASEDLVREHEGILSGLSILERMVSRISSGVDRGDLASMAEFLRLFADTCHHGKEEGILFPAMERHGVPKEGGPIGQMLREHEEGRTYLRGMAQAAAKDPVDASIFVERARSYINLLRAHIDKENRVLFPMGDKAIPEGEQAEIMEAFERHEQTVMGPGVHERLHAMLGELSKKYS